MAKKKLSKILVPLDGSKNSLRGLKLALSLAKQSELSVVGLNVVSISSIAKNSLALTQKIRKKSQDIIKQAEILSKKEKVPFNGATKVSNNIGKTIVASADNRKVDMIIIGSSGPDPDVELFLGSVANHVVNKSKIPVTVVK
ncbi:MAG: universal stress protein [Nitrosopumilus sp.]